jgi:ribosomal protein L35
MHFLVRAAARTAAGAVRGGQRRPAALPAAVAVLRRVVAPPRPSAAAVVHALSATLGARLLSSACAAAATAASRAAPAASLWRMSSVIGPVRGAWARHRACLCAVCCPRTFPSPRVTAPHDSLRQVKAGLPGSSTVRHVRLIPQRHWKRKPGLGVKGGQKLKSHSGANKRFKVTANGKVRVMPTGKQHLNYGTSGQKRQKLRQWKTLHEGQAKTIRMLMLKHRRPLHPYYKPRAKLDMRDKPLNDSELKEMLGA